MLYPYEPKESFGSDTYNMVTTCLCEVRVPYKL